MAVFFGVKNKKIEDDIQKQHKNQIVNMNLFRKKTIISVSQGK